MQQSQVDDNSWGQAAMQYEALLAKLPSGVVIHPKGSLGYASSHAHHIIGAAPGTLSGLNALDYVPREGIPAIEARIRQVAAGDPVPMAEEKFIRVDGMEIDVETMAFPLYYKGQGAVQVIFRDITEKKRAEAQIRKHQTMFSQLFQNVPIAVVLLDE